MLDRLIDEFVIPSDVAEGLQDDEIGHLMDSTEGRMPKVGMYPTETQRANAAFRALSRRQANQQNTAIEASSQSKQTAAEAGKDIEMQDVQPLPEQGEGAVRPERTSLKPTAQEPGDDRATSEGKVAKEVRDLEIDMKGADGHNKQLGL